MESESDSDRPLTRKKKEVLFKKLLHRKLDFVVEHHAGKKMAHADALCRHVGSVVQGVTLEKRNVLREQAEFFLRAQELTIREKIFFLKKMVFCIEVGRKRTSDDSFRDISERDYYMKSRSNLCRTPGKQADS